MKMSWLNGLLVSVGVPVLCAGIAFVAAGLVNFKEEPIGDGTDSSATTSPSLKGGEQGTADSQTQKSRNSGRRGSKKNSRPKNHRANKRKDEHVGGGGGDDGDSSADSGDDDDDQLDTSNNAEEDILRLAAMHHNHHSKASNIVKKTSAEIVFNPITTMMSPNKSEASSMVAESDDKEGWSRIPTKMEGIVGSLKQRIDSLSRQLYEQEQGRAKDRSEFEASQRKWKEAEHDWRERVKTLVQQVNNLENELTGLRANNQYLTEQCITLAELERRSERLATMEEHTEDLEKQIRHLEALLGDAQAAKDAAINTSIAIRSTLEADLDATRCELFNVRSTIQEMRGELADMAVMKMSLESSRSQLYDQLRAKEAELNALLVKLDRLQESNIGLELDIQHTKSLNEQLLSELNDIQSRAADQKYLEEAYTCNNLYITNLMESEHKQFQEKSRLIQELVAVKKQLKSML